MNSLRFSADGRCLAAAVGQEHRNGRWWKDAAARNAVCIFRLQFEGDAPDAHAAFESDRELGESSDEEEEGEDEDEDENDLVLPLKQSGADKKKNAAEVNKKAGLRKKAAEPKKKAAETDSEEEEEEEDDLVEEEED